MTLKNCGKSDTTFDADTHKKEHTCLDQPKNKTLEQNKLIKKKKELQG